MEKTDTDITEFLHRNRKLLIIICDPKDDTIAVSYKDKYTKVKVKSATGKSVSVVKDVLVASKFEKTIGDFLFALADTLHLPFRNANQFYSIIDGALFKLSKSIGKLEAKKKQ